MREFVGSGGDDRGGLTGSFVETALSAEDVARAILEESRRCSVIVGCAFLGNEAVEKRLHSGEACVAGKTPKI